ncbi:MAG: hypothetical protein VX908_07830 [Planctomycetota bacterium]|nr:hypothetical protein [Planctomycetota bacterium]
MVRYIFSSICSLWSWIWGVGAFLCRPPASRFSLPVACSLAALVILSWSVEQLRSHVHRPVEEVTIRFIEAPNWVGESLKNHLGSTAAPWLLGTTLQRADLNNARDALLASGCFRDVLQVHRSGTTTIDVTAIFLEPNARIVDRYGSLLIDHQGLPFPAGYRVDTHLVTLRSPAYDRPVAPDEPWSGTDVAAALSLLQMIDQKPWYDQVVEVDLSTFDRDNSLVLITDIQARIIWGSPPGEEAGLECLAAKKIERLTLFHEQVGRIDQHHRGTIDFTDSSMVTKN